MPQNTNQVQWDSKPDTSGLPASQNSGIQWDSKSTSSGVQWDSSPDTSGLSATPIADKNTMSAAPAWRPWNSNLIGQAEGLNDQGRKEHPFMAKMGDIATSAGQLRDIVGPEIALLGGAFMGGGEPEAPIGRQTPIPDVIAPNPDVAPRPVQSMPTARMPQGPSVSDNLLLQPEAPSTPNTAMRSPMANLNDLLDEQMGVQKLRPNVPLREQLSPSTEVPIHRNPMEVANGKAIFDAAKGNPATLADVHNLSRVEIRQALINSGEDMGQITISSSKYAGSGAISREVAFNRLLAKGYSPEQIVKLAKGRN